ncbi:MAG: GNAT family N-acetyltransferase [Chloroflexi bacterium]|nr:GNAT family N-acetyltransferase [Chloroflexota bacterium]
MASKPDSLSNLQIHNTSPKHAVGVSETVREAFGVGLGEACGDCMTPAHVRAQIWRFPAGQFSATVGGGKVVGMAATMRTSRPPSEKALGWISAIGDLEISAHEPAGRWLYGVEMAVRPLYQGRGIGTKLYHARFQLARRLNLCGWYAVGMLMGYARYAGEMDVVTYGEKVMARELSDPTVTMQMNRGFRVDYVVTDYLDEPAAGDAGVLIVWENPDYQAGAAVT